MRHCVRPPVRQCFQSESDMDTMTSLRTPLLLLLPVLALAGCATAPTGPSVMALPGSGKSFEQFRYDDAECRDYARYQTGGDANQAATDSGVRSAAVGAAVGAAAGALIGGHQGAGVGAGTGLLVGSAAGSDAARASAGNTQRHYDNAYVQCMYAKGQRVPTSGQFSRAPEQAPAGNAPSPSAASYPPPPPGHSAPGGAPQAAVPPSGAGNWYYCESARGYYPYVRQCREGWRVVQASPPPGR